MATAYFEKIGECVPNDQLLATGMENQTNINYARNDGAAHARGQLVGIKDGSVVGFETADVDCYAIVRDPVAKTDEQALVFVSGSFYIDTVEKVTGKSISKGVEFRLNAQGIFFGRHL